jgi:hypothetical protein
MIVFVFLSVLSHAVLWGGLALYLAREYDLHLCVFALIIAGLHLALFVALRDYRLVAA